MTIIDYICSPAHQKGANYKLVQGLKDSSCWEPGDVEFWLVMETSQQTVVAFDRKNFPQEEPVRNPLTVALAENLGARPRDVTFYCLGKKGDLGWYGDRTQPSKWE